MMSSLSQRSETLMSRQSPHENFSDEPTITEKQDLLLSRQQQDKSFY